MKRRQRFGDITIHSKAYVGGVLRGKYLHQRESFSRYALRRCRKAAKASLSAVARPFILLAGALGLALEKLAAHLKRIGQVGAESRVTVSPLYVPVSKADDIEILAPAAAPRRLAAPLVLLACVLVPSAAFLAAFAFIPPEREPQEIFVHENGAITAFRTDSETVGEFLDGMTTLSSSDVLVNGRTEPIEAGMLIEIRRAFPVMVSSKQDTDVLEVVGGTVADALDELSIDVNDGDIISPPPSTAVSPGMKISLVEVREEMETETIRLPFRKEVQKDDSLVVGQTKLKTEGRSGEKSILMRVTLYDGIEVGREIVRETITREPVNQVMLEGTAPDRVPAKELITLRNDNRSRRSPPRASRVVKKMTIEATAYTHTGKTTATGTNPKIGTIAVNPELIPYGTEIYVEGYGWGVAEDTGAFRHRRKPQIDLFMDTVKECINWGRKDVTIYILD